MASDNQSFSFYRGEHIVASLTAASGSGDISDWSLAFYAYWQRGDDPLLTLTTAVDGGVEVTDGPNRIFTVTLPNAITASADLIAGTYHWEAWRTDSGSEDLIASGTFESIESAFADSGPPLPTPGSTPLSVALGGTGAASHTAGRLLGGNGTSAFSEVVVGAGLDLTAGVLTAEAVPSDPSVTGNTLWVDTLGDDGDAAPDSPDLPYLTLAAAKAAASAGDLVYIRPGVYDESQVEAVGVVYWFEPGATLQNTVGVTEITWNFDAAGTYRVYGRGVFGPDTSNVINSSHAGADWLVEAEAINGATVEGYPAVSSQAGTGVIRDATITAPSSNTGSIYSSGGTLTLDRCTIHDNPSGACIHQESGGVLILRDCRLIGFPFANGSVVQVEGTLTLDTVPDPTVTLTGGTVVTPAGSILLHRSEPADATLASGHLVLWYDGTPSASKLMIKAKDTDGTVVVGQVALA